MPNVPAVHSGIAYALAVDADTDKGNQHRLGDDRVMVVEPWQDVAVLRVHATVPHRLAYREQNSDRVLNTQIVGLDTV